MNKTVYQKIDTLAAKYAKELDKRVSERIEEMQSDDNSHYLVYRVLGITDKEGSLIDIYQNKGRFLYKYAGSFLEEAAIICMQSKYSLAKNKVKFQIP